MAPGNLRQPNALDRVLDCVLALMDNDDPKKAKKGAELYDLLAQRQDIANGPLAGWSHAGPAAMATELLEWWVEGGVRPSFLESVPELWKQEEREEWENAPTVEKAGLASGAILPGTSTAGSKPGKKGGAKGKE